VAYGSRSDYIRQAPPDDTAPVVEWDDFLTYVLEWQQDQHLAAIGPTGQGKSTTIHGLLDAKRNYVAYLATKPRDKTLDAYIASGGYERIGDWPPRKGRVFKRAITAAEMPRRLVWPDATRLESEAEQQRVFARALDDIYVQGGWTTVFDDWWYLCHILGFEKTAKKFLTNARSNDIPFVLGAQRPAGNRLVEIFDQAEHLLFFRDNDETNLKRIGGVGWLDSALIRAHVAHLEQYQFLYTNTRSGHMYRSTAPELALAA
jgi:hypothetical protein